MTNCITPNFEIISYLVYGIESIFSTSYQNEEVKIKSNVAAMFRYTKYVFERKSIKLSEISS